MGSCKTDSENNPIFEYNDSFEADYFEDYEAPYLKWGFIDKKNRLVIKDQYDDLRDFSEGFAAANFRGKWGFIDQKGITKIEHQYRSVKSFKNRIAAVQKFNFQWSLIDTSGKETFLLEVGTIEDYNEDFIVVNQEGSFRLLNHNGENVLEKPYQKIILSDGFIFLKQNKEWFIYNSRIGEISEDTYDRIFPSHSNLVRVKRNNRYGFIDQNFKVVIPIEYNILSDFNGAFAVVKNEGSLHFINRKGQLGEATNYEKLKSIGCGMWKYAKNGTWGILNSQLDSIEGASFEYINRCVDNRIGFGIGDEQWGFLDLSGLPVIAPNLPIIWDFQESYSRVIERTGMGMIDTNGNVVIDPIYRDIRDFKEGYARVQKI